MLWTGPILTFALVSIHAAAQTFSGEATYYQTGVGACGKPGNDGDAIVALNSGQFDPFTPPGPDGSPNPNLNTLCGKSVTISYEGKTAQATIVDRCPEGDKCHHGALDLSPSVFEQFASKDKGVFQIQWWFTDGAPEGMGDIAAPSDAAQAPEQSGGSASSSAWQAPQDSVSTQQQGDPNAAATAAQPEASQATQPEAWQATQPAPEAAQPTTQAGAPSGDAANTEGRPDVHQADVQHLATGDMTPRCPVKRRAKRRL